MRLGVKRGCQTASIVFAPLSKLKRAAVTARRSLSTTVRKSRVEQRFADGMCAIVDGFLRVKRSLSLEKATLRVGLGDAACDGREQQAATCNNSGFHPHQDSRLSASRVNASSFIGTLY